ncbi:Uncharacterised protein [Mycobacteroides abscessus]|nr:Uncharacterised protein [Mycobacteroides abscessus]
MARRPRCRGARVGATDWGRIGSRIAVPGDKQCRRDSDNRDCGASECDKNRRLFVPGGYGVQFVLRVRGVEFGMVGVWVGHLRRVQAGSASVDEVAEFLCGEIFFESLGADFERQELWSLHHAVAGAGRAHCGPLSIVLPLRRERKGTRPSCIRGGLYRTS